MIRTSIKYSTLTLKETPQAFAAAKFADACLRGMRGDAGIVECSYVASEVLLATQLLNSSSQHSNSESYDHCPFDLHYR
jgi:hypothetical protein